jgi:hypothetical protein
MLGKANKTRGAASNGNVNSRQNYLRYDDIFMPSSKSGGRSNTRFSQRIPPNNISIDDNFDDDDDMEGDGGQDGGNPYIDDKYFSNSIIMDEKMVRYQKREMPPLQRYGDPNSQREVYSGSRPPSQQYQQQRNGQQYNQHNQRSAQQYNQRNTKQYDIGQQYAPADQDDEYQDRRKYYQYQNQQRDGSHFRSVWNKFVITFTSALSLVCLSWIAYNWSSGGGSRATRQRSSQLIVIEPENPSFKILPDNPGGVDIPYQDKTIYENVDNVNNSFGSTDDEGEVETSVLPAPERPVVKPREVKGKRDRARMERTEESMDESMDEFSETGPRDSSSLVPQKITNRAASSSGSSNINIDEYSIVDEKTYYIKIASGPNKQILLDEAKNIKHKHSEKISGLSCSVKSVKDKRGNKKHALLIGPFDSKDVAISMAKKLDTDCSVVAVKE